MQPGELRREAAVGVRLHRSRHPCGHRERWGCHVLTSQGRGVERRRDPGVHGESLPFACGWCALSVSRFRGAGDEPCQPPSVGPPHRALASSRAASARASRASQSGARVGCPSRHATRRARRPLSRLAKTGSSGPWRAAHQPRSGTDGSGRVVRARLSGSGELWVSMERSRWRPVWRIDGRLWDPSVAVLVYGSSTIRAATRPASTSAMASLTWSSGRVSRITRVLPAA